MIRRTTRPVGRRRPRPAERRAAPSGWPATRRVPRRPLHARQHVRRLLAGPRRRRDAEDERRRRPRPRHPAAGRGSTRSRPPPHGISRSAAGRSWPRARHAFSADAPADCRMSLRPSRDVALRKSVGTSRICRRGRLRTVIQFGHGVQPLTPSRMPLSLVALACVSLGGAAIGRATTFPVTAVRRGGGYRPRRAQGGRDPGRRPDRRSRGGRSSAASRTPRASRRHRHPPPQHARRLA